MSLGGERVNLFQLLTGWKVAESWNLSENCGWSVYMGRFFQRFWGKMPFGRFTRTSFFQPIWGLRGSKFVWTDFLTIWGEKSLKVEMSDFTWTDFFQPSGVQNRLKVENFNLFQLFNHIAPKSVCKLTLSPFWSLFEAQFQKLHFFGPERKFKISTWNLHVFAKKCRFSKNANFFEICKNDIFWKKNSNLCNTSSQNAHFVRF